MAKSRRRVPRYQRPNCVAADLTQQASNNSWSPPTSYVDAPFKCIDCGRDEVWKATQQKWWFEVAKGTIYSRANRCASCRRKLREQHQGTPRKSHQDRRESAT